MTEPLPVRIRYQRGYVDGFDAPANAKARANPAPAGPREEFIAIAQQVRSEHEATHGEAEQCGAECIVMGLAEFEDPAPAGLPDIHRPGTDVYCPVEGVHEHPFRGPHHFREWDPAARSASPGLREALAALPFVEDEDRDDWQWISRSDVLDTVDAARSASPGLDEGSDSFWYRYPDGTLIELVAMSSAKKWVEEAANPAPAGLDDPEHMCDETCVAEARGAANYTPANPAPAGLDDERLARAMCDKAPGECFDWDIHVTQARTVLARLGSER